MRLALSLTLFGILTCLLVLKANANEVPRTFMWSNLRGFVPLDPTCVQSTAGAADFRVSVHPYAHGSNPFSQMLNSTGDFFKNLPDGSIVKTADPAQALNSPQAPLFTYVRVVSVPMGAWGTSKSAAAHQKGFLPRASQMPLQYFGIEIATESLNMDVVDQNGKVTPYPAVSQIADTGLPVMRSQWVIEQNGGQFSTYVCGPENQRETYMVFGVGTGRNGDLEKQIARVLVRRDSAKIFQMVNVFQTRQIPQDHVVEAPAKVPEEIQPTFNPDLVAPVPHIKPVFIDVPVKEINKSELEGDLVVCIQDGVARVRGNPRVDSAFNAYFEVPRGEKVVPDKDAHKYVVTREIGGKSYDFVSVTFPARKPEERYGFIALASVKKKSSCTYLNSSTSSQYPELVIPKSNPYGGKTCSARDTDDLKCMTCAVYTEDHGSIKGAREVARTILARVKDPRFPKTVCKVLWQSNPVQFTGPRDRPNLPKNNPSLNLSYAVAKEALELKIPGQYFFFLAPQGANGDRCSRKDAVQIGTKGNCYRKKAEVMDLLPSLNFPELFQTAEIPMGPSQDPGAG